MPAGRSVVDDLETLRRARRRAPVRSRSVPGLDVAARGRSRAARPRATRSRPPAPRPQVYAAHGRAIAEELYELFRTEVWPVYKEKGVSPERIQEVVERLKPLVDRLAGAGLRGGHGRDPARQHRQACPVTGVEGSPMGTSGDVTPPPLHILVTGATGFVGRRLTPQLVDAGHDVRALTRHPETYDGPGTAVGADVHDPDTLGPAARRRRRRLLPRALPRQSPTSSGRTPTAATAFGEAAAAAGVRQIIYLGGLGAEGGRPLGPPALAARGRGPARRGRRAGDRPPRRDRGRRRAASRGSSPGSWSRTSRRWSCPKWVATRTQPIAVDDVIRYLVGVADRTEAFGRVFEIGGPDQLTYLEMLEIAAEISTGRPVPIVQVPVLTPRLSSYWLALVTDVDVTTGRNLIDSMGTEVRGHRPVHPRPRPGRAAQLRRGRPPGARGGRAASGAEVDPGPSAEQGGQQRTASRPTTPRG